MTDRANPEAMAGTITVPALKVDLEVPTWDFVELDCPHCGKRQRGAVYVEDKPTRIAYQCEKCRFVRATFNPTEAERERQYAEIGGGIDA